MRLQGKVALVTGAGLGMGRAMAELFAREGAKVVAVDLTPGDVNDTLTRINVRGDCCALTADVSDSAQVAAVFAEVDKRYGRLDVLVNNAGIGTAPNDGYDKFYERLGELNAQLSRGETPTVHLDHIIDMQDDGWQRVMDININGVFYNSREAVRLMIKSGAKGSIINIASTSGLNGTGAVHYCASKAAVLGFTKCLARELGGRAIRVNAICPGATNTRMMANLDPAYAKTITDQIPLLRMGEPVEVAYTALFLASDEASYFTGQTLAANGGSHML
ncbi:MAG TPA: SDR family NAD(P)-dependent oxidoreductase [Pseudomonadales bacterium]|nr:SDR family NAD(P)-dependent oxidoreductase [Pseudomonadales bacterium]